MYDDPYYQPLDPEVEAFLALLIWGIIIFSLVMWAFYSYVHYRIAIKAGEEENAWWAWVPILNMILLTMTAKRPLWWIVLLFIPFVNLVINFLLWLDTIREAGYDEVWGVLCGFPLTAWFAQPIVAFMDAPKKPHAPRPPAPEPVVFR